MVKINTVSWTFLIIIMSAVFIFANSFAVAINAATLASRRFWNYDIRFVVMFFIVITAVYFFQAARQTIIRALL
jgi:hypothetical protein